MIAPVPAAGAVAVDRGLFAGGRAGGICAMNIVTFRDLREGIRSLGIEAGDCLLAHTSMKAFGRVQGGPDSVIDAMLDAVGTSGLVVVPTLTLGAADERHVVFDSRSSASTSGLLTEVFRSRQGASRSLHPFSSAAMIGKGADILARHHGDTPCGLSSPYGQVYLRDGWCLLLGAPWSANTMFHVAEEIANPPYLRYALFRDAEVIDARGVNRVVSFARYNCGQTGIRRDLAAMGPIYEERGVVRHAAIGSADCRAIRARDAVDIVVETLASRMELIVAPQKD